MILSSISLPVDVNLCVPFEKLWFLLNQQILCLAVQVAGVVWSCNRNSSLKPVSWWTDRVTSSLIAICSGLIPGIGSYARQGLLLGGCEPNWMLFLRRRIGVTDVNS